MSKLAWSKNGTPNTLSGTADDLEISDASQFKFNQIMCHVFKSGAITQKCRINNNTNSVYAARYSVDGGTDGTSTSIDNMVVERTSSAFDEFWIMYYCSISGEEKLGINFNVCANTAGAATAPLRVEQVNKFVPSPDADTSAIDNNQTNTGDFTTSSNLSAIGTN